MARNVFISFRYRDGHLYKEKLVNIFDRYEDIINYSEEQDRSKMTDETIKRYLYNKLRNTSVTIVLLTPQAINHERNYFNTIDDWMYDEIRYSLEDRENNRTNGLIAVYTPETERLLITHNYQSGTTTINDVDNLFRKNMMNVKPQYKRNPKPNVYDSYYDSYCSLVSWDDFIASPNKYIDMAIQKRENIYKYDIKKWIQ